MSGKYLRQSTASQTRTIGPFVDDTDFKTAEDGLTIANTDIRVKKNGAADVAKNSGGGTADVNGCYAVTWDATDTDTVGELFYTVKVAGALQVFGSYTVLEEAIYDALFAGSANAWSGAAGSSIGVANVTQLNGGSQSLLDLKDFADDGYDPSTNKVQGVVLVDTMAGTIQTLDALDTAQDSQHATTQAAIDAVDNFVDTEVAALTTELAKVPKSDGTASWNATALAALQSEANDALVALKLDHLVAVADADDVVDNSIIAKLAAKGATADWSSFVNTTDSLEALRDRGDAAWTTATGFSTHSATDVWAAGTRTLTAIDEDSTTLDLDATIRAAIGMASANLDTQLTTIDDYLDTEMAATLAAVDTEIGSIQTTLAALFTTALTESYNTDGAAPTVAQALMGIYQLLTEGEISGTGWTVKRLNGSTTAFGITLDSATTPTTKTRSS